MGMIDARKIPPTLEQLRALKEAAEFGSLSHGDKFRAMIEKIQGPPAVKQEPQVYEVVQPTLEQRLTWQMAELAKQVAALREELAALRANKSRG